MGLPALLLLFSLRCSAGAPPAYAPESPVRALTSAMEGAVAALDSIQSTPVEPGRAGRLKSSIDELVFSASSASVSAQALLALGAAPQKAMSAPEPEVVEAAALRREWKALDDQARPFRDELEDWEPPKAETEASKAKARKQRLLKEGSQRLERADRALKVLEELIPKLREALAGAKTEAGLAHRAAWELGRAVETLEKTALLVEQAGPQAKAKIDLLAQPPENEARTRVYQKLDPLIDAVRTLSYQGDVARNRSSTFAERYAACLKRLKASAELSQESAARHAEARAALTAAREPLARLKD